MAKLPRIDYLADFKKELQDIDKLEKTPNLIRDIAMNALNSAISVNGISWTIKKSLENAKQSLANIGDESLENNYKVIYSQMCILAVSSLEATLKRYFENALRNYSNINKSNDDLKNIKISLSELVESNLKYSGKFGKLVLEKTNLNFQDLKSIKRIFSDYISKDVSLNLDDEKKICFYLEARHVLVHKGGVADDKFVRATNSFDANIKGYARNDKVDIDSTDWQDIKSSFSGLVGKVTGYTEE